MPNKSLPSRIIKRIVVNRHIIQAKKKNHRVDPPLSLQTSKGVQRCTQISICDSKGAVVAEVKYNPEKPLSCGATVYIETRNSVVYS
jgi:hypothetical protein